MSGNSISGGGCPPGGVQGVARGQALAYRGADCWPQFDVPASVLDRFPTAPLWVPGAYASVWDLISTSIPEDSQLDFDSATLTTFLLIGASTINGYLGQRGWPVPLNYWSIGVVEANCELAYIKAARRRGRNTDAALTDFLAREAAAREWCRATRDREITPDVRLSEADLGRQAFRYVGQRARGWDGNNLTNGPDLRSGVRRGWVY